MLTFVLGLASCNLDNDPDENFSQLSFSNVCNLVIPTDGDAFTTRGNYQLTYYTTQGTCSLMGSGFSTGVGAFSTTTMTCNIQNYTNGQQLFQVVRFSGGQRADSSMPVISNLEGYSSQLVNLPPAEPLISPYPGPATYTLPLVLQYTQNDDTTVKTFMPDAIYTGKTTIITPSTGKKFDNDEMSYRIYMSNDLQKADVIMYNAKFDEGMPFALQAVVLEGLKVSYNKNGYTVTIDNADGITPKMFMNGKLIEYEMYNFTNFTLDNTSNDLTRAGITYTVLNTMSQTQYLGTFSGSYIVPEPAN